MKMVMSRSQWEKIGKKAGWIEKTSGSVTDGTSAFLDATPYLKASSREDGEEWNPNDYPDKSYYIVNTLDSRLVDGPFKDFSTAKYMLDRNVNPKAVEIVFFRRTGSDVTTDHGKKGM